LGLLRAHPPFLNNAQLGDYKRQWFSDLSLNVAPFQIAFQIAFHMAFYIPYSNAFFSAIFLSNPPALAT
jgi:hypothetical protein